MNELERHYYEFGGYRIESSERLLRRGDDVIRLPPKATDLLFALLESGGRVVTKDELMERVWPGTFVEEVNLSRNIFLLRKTLENGQKFIETIPRRGYRFIAQVAEGFVENGLRPVTADGQGVEYFEKPKTVSTTANQKRIWLIGAAGAVLATLLIFGAGFWINSSFLKSEAVMPEMRIIPVTSDPGYEINPALSPDGKLIAYRGSSEGVGPYIYVKDLDSGTTVQLTPEPVLGTPKFSPDGRFISYSHADALYIVPAAGGTARKLYQATGLGASGWSPDGKQISFSAHSGSRETPLRVYTINIESSEIKELTTPKSGDDGYSHFSPDGTKLAFVHREDNASEAFLLDLASGAQKQLTFDSCYVETLDWAADGNEIVFSSNRNGVFSLWRIAAAGGEPVALPGVGDGAIMPAAALKANRLAYVRGAIDTNIWRVPLGQPEKTAERIFASSRRDESPSFSPDGKSLAFSSTRGGLHEIWIGDADGSNQRQLTFFRRGKATHPKWSPDGRQIVFSAYPNNKTMIYVIAADGGMLRSLTDEQHNSSAPSWSGDGKFIYFGSDRSGSWQIWKMPAVGGEAVQITQNGGYEGRESPDGRFLYYLKVGYNTWGLFRLSFENGEETRILDLPQLGSVGDWALIDDGVYFIHRYDDPKTPTPRPSIKFLDFSSNQITEIVPLPKDPTSDPGLSVSPDGSWFYYSIDDSRTYDVMLIDNFR